MTAALFLLASGLGAAARFRISRFGWTWPGTLLANVVGSFLLGWLLAGEPAASTATVIGTGFLGSLTTFSMFALEATEGGPRRRLTILLSTLVGCLLAATVGHALG